MPTFEGQTFSNFFKNILGINQSSNAGCDTSTRLVQDGAGNATAISLSDDVLQVKPVNDNTTGTFLAKNSGGSNILAVDTTNSKVLIGASQVAANTQYAYFGLSSLASTPSSAANHFAVPFNSTSYSSASSVQMGCGTDPATTLTISTTADDVAIMLWYIVDNITIDAVHVFSGANNTATETLDFHLMSYTIDTGNDADSGDLSGGTVIADGADLSSLGYEQIHYQSMTVQSANVDAGKVCMFFLSSQQDTQNYSLNVSIKYHLR